MTFEGNNRNRIIIISVLLTLVVLTLMVSLPKVSNEHVKTSSKRNEQIELYDVEFPTSLKQIGDEAFAGTSINSINFNKGLNYIGNSAFRNVNGLHNVILPECLQYIGNQAFPQITVIHGVEGSYAESWAKKNGYQFVVDVVSSDKVVNPEIHAELFLVLMGFVIPVDDERMCVLSRRIREVVKSMRPQDRAELYPINYRFP